MSSPNRLKLLSAAFRDANLSCGPLKLRPITAGTINILMDLGNSLFVDVPPVIHGDFHGGVVSEICRKYNIYLEQTEREAMARDLREYFPDQTAMTESAVADVDAYFEFIWVHTAPIDEVLDLVDGDASLVRRECRKLGMQVQFDHLAEFQEQFAVVGARIRAAMVDAVPEDGAPGKSPMSPTGSQPSSGPSTEQVTLLVNGSSSGNSLTSGLSSIATLPSDQPGPLPDGPVILPPIEPHPPTSTPGSAN